MIGGAIIHCLGVDWYALGLERDAVAELQHKIDEFFEGNDA